MKRHKKEQGIWTELGKATRSELQDLTGVDYQRFYLGKWVDDDYIDTKQETDEQKQGKINNETI